MAYKPALGEGELHSLNYEAIRSWLAANKGKLKAPPNKTVLYSGRDYDLEALQKKVPAEERETFMGTQMWKKVAAWQKDAKAVKDRHVGIGFKMLPDILRTLKPPSVVDKDRKEVHYPNAWAFFDELEKTRDLDALLPNRKKIATEVWREMSDAFASNAVGDIEIFDGAADDYEKLRTDKNLILKELPALLRNPNLSKQAKAVVLVMITRYGSYFDRRYTELMKQLEEGRKALQPK